MSNEDWILAQGGRCRLDKSDVELVASLQGRTIISAEWRDDCKPSENDWQGHEYALLHLDDGRTVRFGAWGYDAWAATVADVTDEKP